MAGGMTDQALIEGFLAGHTESHRQVDRWIHEVLRHPRLGLDAEVEDAAQEVRRKLVVSLRAERFRSEASLRTYVWRAAQHVAVDHIRHRIRRPRGVPLQDLPEPATREPTPEAALQRRERREIAERVLASLGEDCRRLWSLIVFEELPYAAVAERMGISEANVKVRAFRCRAKAAEVYRTAVTGTPASRLSIQEEA